MTFADFEKDFMGHFNGYVPVDCYFCTDSLDPKEHYAKLVLIVPWRLEDGASRFTKMFNIQVTEEEKLRLAQWLLNAGDWWKNKLLENSKTFLPI